MALDESNLLSLRLANKEIADRTVKDFTAKYMTSITWPFRYRNGDFGLKGAEILQIRPEFTIHVKAVSLQFQPAEEYSDTESEAIAKQLNQLQNLRTLQVYGVYEYESDAYRFDLPHLRLPRLGSFIVKNCSFCNLGCFSDIINSHRDTLTALVLYDYRSDDSDPTSASNGPRSLKTPRPCVREQFSN